MPKTIDPQIQDFLTALDDAHREGFMAYAENTYSVYEIWLYAGVLGYEGSFCLLYTSPSPRDKRQSRMPSSA